jgi:hypothetical protein
MFKARMRVYIIGRGVLVTLQFAASLICKSQKIDINLNVMTRDRFVITFEGGNRALPTILRQRVHAMTLEHRANTLARYLDLVIALQMPGYSIRAYVAGAP